MVVAHDRHLLRATTDALWIVADGRVAPFDGDLDDYRDWVLARARRGEATAAADAGGADGASLEGSAGDRKAKKREEAAARQQLYARRKPLTERLAKVERELAALTADKVAQDEWLASPAAYADDQRELLKDRVTAQAELTWRLARLETEWLELSEAIEKLGEA
jgi:ATP-binding cassette subfamily F protein 3